jgi:hypothetical protein
MAYQAARGDLDAIVKAASLKPPGMGIADVKSAVDAAVTTFEFDTMVAGLALILRIELASIHDRRSPADPRRLGRPAADRVRQRASARAWPGSRGSPAMCLPRFAPRVDVCSLRCDVLLAADQSAVLGAERRRAGPLERITVRVRVQSACPAGGLKHPVESQTRTQRHRTTVRSP